MNHFDTQMMAILGLMLCMSGFIFMFLKEAMLAVIALFLVFFMVWGDDICSRSDRLSFYVDHFDMGGEIICKDDSARPLLISQMRGWEHKGAYLFKGNMGVDILEDQCEILGQKEPHCISTTTQIVIGTVAMLGFFGWMVWMFRRLNSSYPKSKEHEANKEKISKEQIDTDQKTKNTAHLIANESMQREIKDREIRERDYDDNDDSNRQ